MGKEFKENLCECYCEDLGFSVWVQSDETGLWFNLNDIFKLFNVLKTNRRNLIDSLSGNDKRLIPIDRGVGDGIGDEIFVKEHIVHEVISINRKNIETAENFIYNIMNDYHTRFFINDGNGIDPEKKMALKVLKNRLERNINELEPWISKIKGTKTREKFDEFSSELKKEAGEDMDYKYIDNENPGGIREDIEEFRNKLREEKRKEKEKSDKLNKELDEMNDFIYTFIDKFDGIGSDNMNLVDDILKEIRSDEEIDEIILKKNKEVKATYKRKSTCPSWLKDIVKQFN